MDQLFSGDFPYRLVNPLALQLGRLEPAQPLQVGLPLARKTRQALAGGLAVVLELEDALLLIKEGQRRFIPFDHGCDAGPHPVLLHVVQVSQDFLHRPFIRRRASLHVARGYRGDLAPQFLGR